MVLANDGTGSGGVNPGWSPAVDILLKAVGDTPIMKTKKWAVERTRTIQGLVDFIKKFLKLMASEQLVGAAGSPACPAPGGGGRGQPWQERCTPWVPLSAWQGQCGNPGMAFSRKLGVGAPVKLFQVCAAV